MNYNTIIVYDYETTSANAATTQPVQIAALAVNSRTMEIIPNSEFQSLIKPVFDPEKCKRLYIDPLEDGAIKVHGKTQEILEQAPSLESVWKNFTDYVNQYNYKKNAWSSPIVSGYNTDNFDNIITERICTKEPYKLGPISKNGTQGLFHPRDSLDMMKVMWLFFENDKDINSLSVDNLIRGHMGYTKGTAHDAMSDVVCIAELLCRTMKWLRTKVKQVQFKGAFANDRQK